VVQLPRGRPKVLDQILNRTNLARHSKRRGGSRQSSARRLKSSRRRSAPKRRLNSQGNHSKPPRLNSRKRARTKSSHRGNHNGPLSMPALGVTGLYSSVEVQARIRELIKLAKEQGYLTFDDLNEALPEGVTAVWRSTSLRPPKLTGTGTAKKTSTRRKKKKTPERHPKLIFLMTRCGCI